MSMQWTASLDWSSDDSVLRKQLLGLTRPRLVRLCKLKKVADYGFKSDVIDRLIDNRNKQPQRNKNKKLNKKQTSNNFININSITHEHWDDEKTPASPGSPPLPQSPMVITDIDVNVAIKPFHIKVDKLKVKKRQSYIWILDKNRRLQSIASPIPIASPQSRRLSLTNSHNFLWITAILRGTVSVAKKESEITHAAFNRILSLLPPHYRSKIWEIINVDQDSYIVHEDFAEFVDCLLIATGQSCDINHEVSMEIRDMSPIFNKIVNIEDIFNVKEYLTDTVSKSKAALSVDGARRIILNLRNLEEEDGHKIRIENDLALPILTGLTKKALVHGVAFCTRSYWKILTDVFWDEEDEKDLALCTPISHFNNIAEISIEDLFGELYCEMSYDLAHIYEEVQDLDNQIDLEDLDQHLNI